MAFQYAGRYGPEAVTDRDGNAQLGTPIPVLDAAGAALATLYINATRTTQAANPVLSDAATGNLTFYADPGDYQLSTPSGLIPITVPMDPRDLPAHVAATDPHGDRAHSDSADTAHTAATDPHGDRADATSKIATHSAAADPHGDRGYADTRLAALVNAAPAALDTLDELATALGDDANFAATMTTALAGKLNIVVHGATAGTARPAAATQVLWIGTVAPTNAATNDLWWDKTATLLKLWSGSAWQVSGSGAYGALAGPNTWTGSQNFTGATVTGIAGGGAGDTVLLSSYSSHVVGDDWGPALQALGNDLIASTTTKRVLLDVKGYIRTPVSWVFDLSGVSGDPMTLVIDGDGQKTELWVALTDPTKEAWTITNLDFLDVRSGVVLRGTANAGGVGSAANTSDGTLTFGSPTGLASPGPIPVGMQVTFQAGTGTLPTGITAGTQYWVIASTTTTMKVSASPPSTAGAGTPVIPTAAGTAGWTWTAGDTDAYRTLSIKSCRKAVVAAHFYALSSRTDAGTGQLGAVLYWFQTDLDARTATFHGCAVQMTGHNNAGVIHADSWIGVTVRDGQVYDFANLDGITLRKTGVGCYCWLYVGDPYTGATLGVPFSEGTVLIEDFRSDEGASSPIVIAPPTKRIRAVEIRRGQQNTPSAGNTINYVAMSISNVERVLIEDQRIGLANGFSLVGLDLINCGTVHVNGMETRQAEALLQATISSAATDASGVITTSAAHGFAVGQPVVATGTLPTGLTAGAWSQTTETPTPVRTIWAGQVYYVKSVPTSTTLTLATVSATGTTVTMSASAAGGLLTAIPGQSQIRADANTRYVDVRRSPTMNVDVVAAQRLFVQRDAVPLSGQPLPTWTTATRPTLYLFDGMVGVNTSVNKVETYVGGLWYNSDGTTAAGSTLPAPDYNFEADSILAADLSGGTITDGAALLTWTSGNATVGPNPLLTTKVSALSATPVYKTAGIGGKPSIRWAQTPNQGLQMSAGTFGTAWVQPFVYVMVFQILTNAATQHQLIDGVTANAKARIDVGSGSLYRAQAGNVASASGAPATNLNAHVLSVIWNGASSTIRLDGTSYAPSTNPGSAGLDGITLGISAALLNPHNGDIAVARFYKTNQPNTTTLHTIEQQLGTKYGITVA